jgi:alkaline phosphatase D
MFALRQVFTLFRFNVYDDHEIINNFAGLGNDSLPYPNAADAWKLYNGAANPDARDKGEHYYDFRYGDVAFFVMDTRRYRSDVFTTEEYERTMLGDQQIAALYEWLGKVSSSSPVFRSQTFGKTRALDKVFRVLIMS